MAHRKFVYLLSIVSLLIVFGCGSQTAAPGWSEAPRETPHEARAERPAPAEGRDSRQAGGQRHDLSDDESRGGHTLAKHVGRSDGELSERLRRERNISASSTWTDRNAAEETVGDALQAERDKVASWEGRGYPRANLALHFNANRVIGRSLRRGDSQVVPCTSAVIVLKADSSNGFFVLTTYPEARE